MTCITCNTKDVFMVGTEDPPRCLHCHDALVGQIQAAEPAKILVAIDKDQKKLRAVSDLITKWRAEPDDFGIRQAIYHCLADDLQEAIK